jgi:hypothetical protein
MSNFHTLRLIKENKEGARTRTHTHTHTYRSRTSEGLCFASRKVYEVLYFLKSQNHLLMSYKSFFHDSKAAGTWICPFTISTEAITLCFIRPHGEHTDYFTFKKIHVNEQTGHRSVCVPTRIINNRLNIILCQKSLAAVDIKGSPMTPLI